MALAWITDPHFNFASKEVLEHLLSQIRDSDAEALLISGDIAEAHDVCFWVKHLAAELSLPVYFVLGNHDYYHGTIDGVRGAVSAACQQVSALTWLGCSGPVWLRKNIALVGHGGWGDARLGKWAQSPVRLNDHRLIADLTGHNRAHLQGLLHELGDEAAAHLHKQLEEVAHKADTVLVLTHVPPFRGACWHEGELSNDDWLGDFTCAATGNVLRSFADAHRETRVQVYCGHTHSDGVYQDRANLIVTTGGARYRQPAMQPLIAL